MPHRNQFDTRHLPNNRLSLEDKRERRVQRRQEKVARFERYLYLERVNKNLPESEKVINSGNIEVKWYIACMDQFHDGNIESLEKAIHSCMDITDDGRKYWPVVGAPLPWFVKKIRTGFYDYEGHPGTRYGTLWIGTRENFLEQGFGELLTIWEKAEAEYQIWKKERNNA